MSKPPGEAERSPVVSTHDPAVMPESPDAPGPARVPAAPGGIFGIRALAHCTGVSERTLRYYEEVDLLSPTERSPGRARRYVDAHIERVHRIRELQALMGFNLDEIRAILAAEDRLGEMRERYRAGTGDRDKLVEDGTATLSDLLCRVDTKIERLQEFRDQLQARLARWQPVQATPPSSARRSGPADRRHIRMPPD